MTKTNNDFQHQKSTQLKKTVVWLCWGEALPMQNITLFKMYIHIMIIGHVNINSLRNKVEPIHGIMSNSLCDILTLTETKIDGSFPSAQFSVKNYALHRQDRNVHGGGIVTYIRSDLPHRRRTDIESNGNGIETIVLEVQLHEKEKWFICSCYKPSHTKIVCLKVISTNCWPVYKWNRLIFWSLGIWTLTWTWRIYCLICVVRINYGTQ